VDPTVRKLIERAKRQVAEIDAYLSQFEVDNEAEERMTFEEVALQAMRESGVPMSAAANVVAPREMDGMAALIDCGVPLRETSDDIVTRMAADQEARELVIMDMSEATGIPFKYRPLDEVAGMARDLGYGVDAGPMTGLEALEECGVPLVDGVSEPSIQETLEDLVELIPRNRPDGATVAYLQRMSERFDGDIGLAGVGVVRQLRERYADPLAWQRQREAAADGSGDTHPPYDDRVVGLPDEDDDNDPQDSTCPACSGNGVLDDTQVCPRCFGTGQLAEDDSAATPTSLNARIKRKLPAATATQINSGQRTKQRRESVESLNNEPETPGFIAEADRRTMSQRANDAMVELGVPMRVRR
jgi:hypothetical protein